VSHPDAGIGRGRADAGGRARRYRITVRGRVSERAVGHAFEGMSVEHRPGETTFVGELVDQSQLYGVLERLHDFGLELVRVEEVPA
jgi:hypothetical protein